MQTEYGGVVPAEVDPGRGSRISEGCGWRDAHPVRARLLYAPIVVFWIFAAAVASGLCSAETVLVAAPVVAGLALCLNLICGVRRPSERAIWSGNRG